MLKRPLPLLHLYLHFCGCALCFGALFYEDWPAQCQKFFEKYWDFTLWFCVQFLMLLSLILIQQELFLLLPVGVIFFLFSAFTMNEKHFVFRMLATLLPLYFFAHTAQEKYFLILGASTYVLCALFCGFLQKIVFKTRTLKNPASFFFHEVATPLAALHLTAKALDSILPELDDVYRKAQFENAWSLSYMKKLPLTLIALSQDLKQTSTLFCLWSGDFAYNLVLKKIWVQEMISSSLRVYPFKSEQKKMLTVGSQEDFSFLGDENLMRHVLQNLIKNAFCALEDARSPHIFIWVDPKERALYIKDTGQGIDKARLPFIFKKNVSNKPISNSGMGLYFCHNAIQAMNGHISCVSEKGIFTEFKLTFPRVP